MGGKMASYHVAKSGLLSAITKLLSRYKQMIPGASENSVSMMRSPRQQGTCLGKFIKCQPTGAGLNRTMAQEVLLTSWKDAVREGESWPA